MTMEAFSRLTAVALPLMFDNIDTDIIIPSREMKTVGKTGLADDLFAGWRYVAAGSREKSPDFLMNRARPAEHTSELQSLMRISYAVFCVKKKQTNTQHKRITTTTHNNHSSNQVQ